MIRPDSGNKLANTRQRWELVRVLYLQARIGWIALGLFGLSAFVVTTIIFDPARPAPSSFLWVYFSAVALGMSGAALSAVTNQHVLLSLWRRLPGALPLVRSSVLLAGCVLWGIAALGGAILALRTGSLAPLSSTLGAASAALGIGFGLLQNTASRVAWSLVLLTVAALTGFVAWPVLQYLLMPVWPVVWFAYRPDLAATAPMPKFWTKLLRFFERMYSAPPLPSGRADPRLLMSARRMNVVVERVLMTGFSLACGWYLRELPFQFLVVSLVVYVPLLNQLTVPQWLSPRLLSLPGGLVRTRIADTLFQVSLPGCIRTSVTYSMLWVAGLWLFRPLTASQGLALMAIAVSATLLSAAWSIVLQPLLNSPLAQRILCLLLTALTVSGILLAALAGGWREQLGGFAAAAWALAEFALSFTLAWGLVRISRSRWAHCDFQSLVNNLAKLHPTQQYWNSYLNKERS